MSNIDSDGFVDIPSSLNSGSDISKDPTKTDVVSPSTTHRESAKKLSDIPDDWKPPSDSEPRARRRFTRLCTVILKQPDLEEVWQVVRKENGWKTYNQPMHDEVPALRVGQALVLLAGTACLMSPGSVKHLSEISVAFYMALLFWSSLLSIMGLLCQASFGSCSMLLELCESCEEHKKPFTMERYDVLLHLALFRAARLCLAYSLGCLAGALCIVVLVVNSFTSFAVTVPICIILDATFMKEQLSVTWVYPVFGSVWIGILVHYILWNRNALGIF